MDRKYLIIFAVVAIAALIGLPALTQGGFIGTAQTQSISSTTLNGKDAFLVSFLSGGGADTIYATISNPNFPNKLFFSATEAGNKVVYTLTQRQASNADADYFSQKATCDGWACAQYASLTAPMGDFSKFKQQCLASSPYNLVYDAGTALNPKFRCYEKKTRWIVSDFNRLSAVVQPTVVIDVNTNYQSALETTSWAELSLTAANPRQALIGSGGQIGEISMSSLAPTFTTVPEGSAVNALLDPSEYCPACTLHLVDASAVNQMDTLKTNFISCQLNARLSTSETGSTNLWGTNIPLTGAYDDALMQKCINDLKTGEDALQYIKPAANTAFYGADVSNLSSQHTISIQNKFSIPSINMWVYADSVGVKRMTAVPASASCDTAIVPAGATTRINCQIVNGAQAGIIYWGYTCPSPYTVLTPSGSVSALGYETKQVQIDVHGGTSATSATACTFTVQSTDLTQSKQAISTVSTPSSICTITPRPNFYVRINPTTGQCEEYCPLSQTNCAQGQTFDASTCSCTGTTPNPNPSPTPTPTPTPINQTQCLPLIQKPAYYAQGGVNVPILGNFGGSTVQVCETDYGGVIIVAALIIAALWASQRKR